MDGYIGLDTHSSSCTLGVLVTAVSESRGPKSDKLDAFGVAERLRIGAIKRKVYKERGQFAALGHRAKAHWLLVGDGSGDEPDQEPHAVTRSAGVRDRRVLRHRSLGVDYSSTAGCASHDGASVPGARCSHPTTHACGEGANHRGSPASRVPDLEELPRAGSDPHGGAVRHRGHTVYRFAELLVWHEEFGTVKSVVEIRAGQTTTVEMTLPSVFPGARE